MTYGPVGPKSWALGTRWIKIEALFPAALLHELGEGSTTSSEGRGSEKRAITRQSPTARAPI